MELQTPDNVRVAAIDLDGTLLGSDETLSTRTQQALTRWADSGRLFIIVTARPPRSVRWLRNKHFTSGLAICSNGALLYDFETDSVTVLRCLDIGIARALVYS